MGGADVIPGVSGGTIAFITGIYEELLSSLKSIDLEAISLLVKLKLPDFWKKINGNFLITVLAGIATSVLSLARVMNYLLEAHPIYIWSFFFGLILISSPLILRSVTKWSPAVVGSFILGIGIAYGITVLSPSQTPESLWFVFLCGGLAICAMILPGVSGAFILLVLGKYEFIVNAVFKDLNIPVLLVFMVGCLTGLLSFSRLLSWILKHYHNITVAILAGFMLGSLNKVWPWKECLSYRIDSHGEQICAFDKSILPTTYLEKTGNDPQVLQAILMAALGIIMVVLIEKVAQSLKTKI